MTSTTTTTNNNNNNINTINNTQKYNENSGVWDTKSKCVLLEALGKYLPLGVNKHFSILNCTIILAEKLPQKNFSYEQVLKEINEFYNLDELDDDVFDEDEKEAFYLPESYKPLMEEKLKSKK